MERQRSWSTDRINELDSFGEPKSSDADHHRGGSGLPKSSSATALTKDCISEEDSGFVVDINPSQSPESTLHSSCIHSRVESTPYMSTGKFLPSPPQHRLGFVNQMATHVDASSSAQSLSSVDVIDSRSRPPKHHAIAAQHHHIQHSMSETAHMALESSSIESTVRTVMPTGNDMVSIQLGRIIGGHHHPPERHASLAGLTSSGPNRSIMDGGGHHHQPERHASSAGLTSSGPNRSIMDGMAGDLSISVPGHKAGVSRQMTALSKVRASSTAQYSSGGKWGYSRSQTTGLPLGDNQSSSSDDCEEATKRLLAGMTAAAGIRMSNTDRTPPVRVISAESSRQRRSVTDMESNSSSIASLNLTSEEAEALERRRQSRSNYHLTSGQAAVELFLRLNHARQTLDFVKRQASMFSTLDRAEMDIWEGLDTLNELREYETALMAGPSSTLDPDMPLRDHALQTAELCRLAHPDKDWLHLVGLIHGLGKMLAHHKFGTQPQWATCGESYPLGCRFDNSIQGGQFFTANPDRRRRMYQTPLGIYQQGCGLQNVFMSWSASEYLYLMLLLNDTELPKEALFIIRYQMFFALTRPGNSSYRPLLNADDEAMLPLLASFQKLSSYKRVVVPESQAFTPEQQRSYYDRLIAKYIGKNLAW